MKFIVDKYVPFISGVLEPYGEVSYLEPEEITPEAVREADALIVRTRTRVDQHLLGDSKCRFVATATIGMDHIDTEWCSENGITAVNAPGCNAPAVAQYVLSAIARLTDKKPADITLAVVGVGNVGSIVAKWAEGLGMKVLPVDPPRQEREGGEEWYSLADAARLADVITFHTPLVKNGPYPTFHLADADFFRSLAKKPVIINSSRGSVVDNRAWSEAIDSGLVGASAVDVWENEPDINLELMEKVEIATPHIAGYSVDGKIRATQMVLDALGRHFGIPELKATTRTPVEMPVRINISDTKKSYNPMADTQMMRGAMASVGTPSDKKKVFENLRDSYHLRKEITRRPRILIIYTGGTIGMIENPVSHALQPFDFTHLIENVPKIRMLDFDIDNYQFNPPIDSSDMNPDHWRDIASIIEKNYRDYDGFVVLHGTDTMAYTASALSFMLQGLDKPVIITGSQLPIGEVRTDGEENLITAVQIAAARDAEGNAMVREVAILFEDFLWRGCRSSKRSADNFNAFESSNYPPLARIGLDIEYDTKALARPSENARLDVLYGFDSNVATITLHPGIDEKNLRHALNAPDLKGVVLRTYGAGNCPLAPWFINALKEAIERGIVIFNVTQCTSGPVRGRYVSGDKLSGLGVISGHDITYEAAVTKMMHLFAQNLSADEIRHRLAVPLVGEMTTVNPTV